MGGTGDRRAMVWSTLAERLGLGAFTYAVPRHANTLWYCLGALTLVSFIVLVVTGFLLAQWYNPLPAEANQSVRDLAQETRVAAVARGIHSWAAQLMVLTLLLHVARVFATASYRRPREANWLIGVLLLFVTVGLYFSGTVLKWDQEAYEAMLHNMEAAKFLGAVAFLFAESTRRVPMLVRLYVTHVSVLPALLTLLMAAHFFLVKRHGISPSPRSALGETTFARHLRLIGAYALVVLGTQLWLAALRPPGLGPAPVEGIEVTKPPWLFLPLYSLENVLGLEAVLCAPLALLLLLVLVPFVDRLRPGRPGLRRAVVTVAVVVMLLAVAAGAWAWWAAPTAHVAM